MAEFYLRDIPEATWKQARKRAAKEGHTLKWLLLRWLQLYVEGLLDVRAKSWEED